MMSWTQGSSSRRRTAVVAVAYVVLTVALSGAVLLADDSGTVWEYTLYATIVAGIVVSVPMLRFPRWRRWVPGLVLGSVGSFVAQASILIFGT